ncbi:ATP-binding protein [Streptomyces echinatus]|uniref:ATP-binding protein n=1 Tax=Streptomyces echinatus TaxID=67293 RepID=UPI0035569E07
MSHLRAPAARADRREGGRHGRPVTRPAPALPETHIRPQLMRLAVLPPLAVALSATAAVLFSLRSTGARTGPVLWAVLAGAVTVAVAGILIAAVAAERAARLVADRVDDLRRTAARGEADLHALVDALRQGESPPQRGPRRRPPADADDFELLAADLARAHDGAVTAVVRAAQLSSQTGSEQKLEVFVNLARRLQSLVHREISILDDLENEIEDPDLLKGLFHVDHLATRIRRHAENLAVLGGAVSRRQWSNPVSMTEVLRSAIAEVEQYSRVKLVPPIDGELRGHSVADVIHLLAELIENATVFSAPHTQVLLRATLVTSGLAVEVEDRGLGMPVGEQNRMNALLADPDQVNVASLLADGRIGLYVVSQLARRHGIHVRLQSNIYGGVQAVLVVPQALLGNAPGVPATESGAAVPQPQRPPQPQTPPPHPVDTGPVRQVRAPVPAPARETPPRAGSGAAAHGGAGVNHATGSGTSAGTGNGATGGTGSGATGGTEPGSGAGEAPGTGRRRHAQRGSGRRGTENGVRGRHGGAPAPLPVRGADESRPTPADAVPGVGTQDRAVVEAHAGTLPTPRVGPVRGTMDKPRLPRRRAQEHIVPQLRGGPAPRQGTDTVAGHDPGLMAAFQRGIGLAEAQQNLDPEHEEPEYGTPAHGTPEYGTPAHGTPAHGTPAHGTPAHGTPTYPASSYEHMGSTHTDAGHMAGAYRSGSPGPGSTEPARTRPEHGGPDHFGTAHDGAQYSGSHSLGPDSTASRPMGSPAMGSQPMGPDHTVPPAMGPDHTGSGHTGSGYTVSGRTVSDHTASGHTVAAPAGPAHMVPDHTAPEPIASTTPIPKAHAHVPASDGIRGTGRTEGSAPAG